LQNAAAGNTEWTVSPKSIEPESARRASQMSISDAKKKPIRYDLSSNERLTLESMARRYTSPYCDVIPAKIILLADEGLSNDVIVARSRLVRSSASGASDFLSP
jgi:hypothetical protein